MKRYNVEIYKLKEIIDKIGYKIELHYNNDWCFIKELDDTYKEISILEIIFTEEFMYKFIAYTWSKDRDNDAIRINYDLMIHLDNPVSYIYNILELWKLK